MAGFVVAHFRKVKTDAGLGNVAAHNSREGIILENGSIENDPEKLPKWLIHPDRTYRNEGALAVQREAVIRHRYGAIERANLKRKPQRNAAAAVEAVFSASPGAFKTFGEWKRYFADCLEWADKKFGHDNVLQWNTHYDEKTPHLHVLLVPIIRDPHLGNKYSSSDFLGGREGLRQIQDEVAEKVGKNHGLERGQEGSKARHTDQTEWVASIRKKEKDLRLQKEELIKREQELKNREVTIELAKNDLKPEQKILQRTLEEASKYADAERLFLLVNDRLPGFVDQCAQAVMNNKDRPTQQKKEYEHEQGRGRR